MALVDKKAPELRLKGFTEDWELCKFEDLLDKENGIRRGPFGSALKKEFFVKNSDFVVYEQQNAIYDHYETRYKITEEKYNELKAFNLTENDFIMSGAGTIGRISKVPKGIKPGVFNQALIRFRIECKRTDSEYFIQFMRYEGMQKKLTGANPGSAITNLVPMSEVKKWEIVVPQIEEQVRVGKFLKKLDNTITLHQRKLDHLKDLKQAYLQQLFPSDGNYTPKVRFANFKINWEQCKLNKIAELNPKSVIPEVFEYVDLESVVGIELIGHRTENKYSAPSRAQRLAQNNDIFFQTVRPYQKNNYLFELPYNNYVFSTGYAQIRPRNNGYFLLNLVQEKSFVNKVLERCTGTSYPAINSNDLAEIPIRVPIDTNEEIQIGSFFKQLDKNITLHKQKLSKLERLKSAYLQKMFI